jgi:metal-sulfur cluster biosynthetic enzyme
MGTEREVYVMRRLVITAVVGLLATANSGCLLNIWSGDDVRRARELLVVSEDLRVIQDEWERIWFIDQPSHLTPYRVHGGVFP